ncbi:DUF1876 domain-containing protein [Acidimicrobiaceae bacterium USS-CC1]|uniref:DUF1876 domain-containing protein n=1 Tax=Acidiferrimicrobium australe TaxID=2664430 RepID=A0ABW9QYV9_9ACTN|nr:DUF1876 domain-containing protein [Acidiferrimicrobium australe]
MHLELSEDQAVELERLAAAAVTELGQEIAISHEDQHRAQLLVRRDLLAAAREALRGERGERGGALGGGRASPSGRPDPERVWTAEVVFSEDEERTRADARMRAAQRDWHGWGRARRNPADPDVPLVGEELAAARALVDLAHQLLDAAAQRVEVFERRPVHLHT